MKMNSGEFETSIFNGEFIIAITQESNFSRDGGHIFETVTNSYELNRHQAVALIDELEDYIEKTR